MTVSRLLAGGRGASGLALLIAKDQLAPRVLLFTVALLQAEAWMPRMQLNSKYCSPNVLHDSHVAVTKQQPPDPAFRPAAPPPPRARLPRVRPRT